MMAGSAVRAGTSQEALDRERSGDLKAARALLEQQSSAAPDSVKAEALAEFLDRHNDAGRHDALLRWANLETDSNKKQLSLRETVLLDVEASDRKTLAADLQMYRAAGGSDLDLPSQTPAGRPYSTIVIPGPLSSFARMAALSPDIEPRDVLPSVARNVVTNGYEASGNELLQQTEYLRLLLRYLSQARELQGLAHNDVIAVPACDSVETGNLLRVLGYRMRGSCGSDLVLETVNPTRAFLTIDSGFPLNQLEQSLRANHRFELKYAASKVPVLYTSEYWLNAAGKNNQSDFLDAFTSDPSLCRLYLGLAHISSPVAEALRKQSDAAKLKLHGSVLDFYGAMFQIRNGAAVVPGSVKVWQSLVGASPSNPGQFFDRLITDDDGWLAAYYDTLRRIEDPRLAAYLEQPDRMRHFYEALHGKITTPGPARPIFRTSTDLMFLTASLRLDANGAPHVPGGLEPWRTLMSKRARGRYDPKVVRSPQSWQSSDDLVEALFALSRKIAENEPLKIFLVLNDIDRYRATPLSTQTTSRLIAGYHAYGAQYRLFAENPSVSETSIDSYLDWCGSVGSIRDTLTRADAAGIGQSLFELWAILSRQGSIPAAQQDATFAKLVRTLTGARQSGDLFTAARDGSDLLLAASGETGRASRQQQWVTLLAGPMRNIGDGGPVSPAETFLRIFDSQRLISLDALFSLADHVGKGQLDAQTSKAVRDQLERIKETQELHASISRDEKNASPLIYWTDKHVDAERKFDLDSYLKTGEKKDGRSVLTPFVRDSLVGLVYAYYAPPGAQILFTNPMFVREHDFFGPENYPAIWRETEVSGSGWPASAGGRLVGSLIALPYALAQAEQNFMSPRHEQALIWGDLVPQVVLSTTITRWRNVTPDQIRWVSLHLRHGRNLLAAAELSPDVQAKVLNAALRYMTPGTVERIQDHLRAGDFRSVLSDTPPSYIYALASDPTLKGLVPDITTPEIAAMASAPGVQPEVIAANFGTAKPTLTHCYRPGLLYLRTFPALMGYSSRVLAETWESNNLMYAELADSTGIPADRMDAYAPEWNRMVIENIFATNLEDWPALVRSLNTTADGILHPDTQQSALAMSTN